MNYTDLTATERDVLTAIIVIENQEVQSEDHEPGGHRTRTGGWIKPSDLHPTANSIHRFFEEQFGPISRHHLSANVLHDLCEYSLTVKDRSETDARVWVYEPTSAGYQLVGRALRERHRWILPPEPTSDNETQSTLPEVLQA